MDSTEYLIPVREMSFSFESNNPQRWFDNSTEDSHLFNGASLLIVSVERYLVENMKAIRPKIRDKNVLDGIDRLVAQEAIHTRAHIKYNDMLIRNGYEVNSILERFDEDYRQLTQSYCLEFNIALVVAAEHFLTLLSMSILESIDSYQSSDEEILALWAWHTTEEMEHKSVSFDTIALLSCSYLDRVKVMFIMTMILAKQLFYSQEALVKQDMVRSRGGIKLSHRVVRAKRMFAPRKGLFHHFIERDMDFYKPSFHPDQIQGAHLVEVGKKYFEADYFERVIR